MHDPEPDDESAEGKLTMLTASVLALRVRANVLEAALAKSVQESRGQEAGVQIYLWMKENYRKELHDFLRSLADQSPDLATALKTILDEID
jgi:hypothetical protein